MDEEQRDLIVIDGNEVDLEVCSHEDELMNRVWRLSKPPTDMQLNEPTITARRIYRQNRLIRSPEACVHPPVDDNARCPKRDKRKRIKDPCGCCDACATNENTRKKPVHSEIKFYNLPSQSALNDSSKSPL